MIFNLKDFLKGNLKRFLLFFIRSLLESIFVDLFGIFRLIQQLIGFSESVFGLQITFIDAQNEVAEVFRVISLIKIEIALSHVIKKIYSQYFVYNYILLTLFLFEVNILKSLLIAHYCLMIVLLPEYHVSLNF